MSDFDISFGDVEESTPEVHLRPDRNKHYACVPYEEPEARDLPIYVDVDVMRDMEEHALTDTGVELGGVLLGGQFEDEHGNPFVLISDSLRAEHYESTKGSFKFTHETWEEITRQREEFPDDLQMVGWYHTHPDWGVFLSGMDMFICDNFFNRKLDVALVIDPCRQDRGMFMWTGDPSERVRRCGGFYIIGSRFREHELQYYSTQLESGNTMADPRGMQGGFGAPIVNVTRESNQWQMVAVMGMLTMQFLLIALLFYKMFEPTLMATKEDEEKPKAEKLDDEVAERQRAVERQEEFLNRFYEKSAPDTAADLVSENQRLSSEIRRLRVATDSSADAIATKSLKIASLGSKLETSQEDLERQTKTSAERKERIEKLTEKVEALEKELKEATGESSDEEGQTYLGISMWAWVSGVVAIVLAIVAALTFTMKKEGGDDIDDYGESYDADASEASDK